MANYCENCKKQQQEIKSLLRDKAHLEETCNAEQNRGDEWKRRATAGLEMLSRDGRWQFFVDKYPEANGWLEDA